MKGVLEPTDYRESSTGFPFEIHKSRAGNGSEPEAFEVAVLPGNIWQAAPRTTNTPGTAGPQRLPGPNTGARFRFFLWF